MSDAVLAQVILVAVVLAVLIGITAGTVALITILRRRRMSTLDVMPPPPSVIAAPSSLATAPEPFESVVDEKPVIEPILLDPSEPTSLTIEPDAGPTARECYVQRLIDHLRSDSDTPVEPQDP